MSFNIAFVLFPDFEELDFVGPDEVLAATAKHIDKEWRPFTVAQERMVKSTNGLTVQADYTFAEAPDADLVLVPGGQGTNTEVGNAELIAYIKRAGESAEYITSVCTGAFLLHKAGFLAGKRATTHWSQLDELRALGDVTVEEERWVHDGNVITAAGVSAGIDMALYLLGVLKSPQVARTVQRGIEYDPSPPYADVEPLRDG
ncbi:MAG: DJ-1/PfpI family protein [Chloroflexi bacterium]|nr:DJ-1/PfpI family protein [Chloroflexota bacterium]